MRLIDADEAKKLERMVALKPSERALFRLMLDRMPTYEPPNNPLTLEELREMDGEPVWVIPFGGSSTAQYAIVNVEKERLCVSDGDYSPFGDYGRYVLAYRRKPEEGTL